VNGAEQCTERKNQIQKRIHKRTGKHIEKHTETEVRKKKHLMQEIFAYNNYNRRMAVTADVITIYRTETGADEEKHGETWTKTDWRDG